MSRSSLRPPENWVPGGEEYWVYLPSTAVPDFFPARPSLLDRRGRRRDPPWLIEERSIGRPSYGSTRLPPPATPHPTVPLLLIHDYDTFSRAQNPARRNPPTYYQEQYYQAPREEESKLSEEEQKQAMNKLRKQLYSPHLNSIVKRLGTKSAASEGGRSSLKGSGDEDDMKRCAVCLEDFETKQFVTKTPCNHMFHEECIVPWVKSQGKCPVCRFVIVEKIAPPCSNYTTGTAAAGGGGIDRELMSVMRSFDRAFY